MFSCIFVIVICSFLLYAANAYGISAFPGAEGFGSTTAGGRGGTVIEVANLNDDGPGSLRAACENVGPRVIVFRTGGTIILKSDIEIENPYITIAGQTAPGDGICIRRGAIRVYTHDVIIRGLRIRVGDESGGPPLDNRDGLGIANSDTPPYNIIIDHCSISWGLDENVATWFNCHDITFQWCIVSEGILTDGESYGMLIGDYSENISVHHNLFAHNKDRSPLLKNNTTAEVINNVVYNWRWYATRTLSNANIMGNLYKTGSNWTGGNGVAVDDMEGVQIFVLNNIGPGRETNTGDNWLAVYGLETHRSDVMVMSPSNVKIDDVTNIFESVLGSAGAIAPHKDPVDERIIQSVLDGTGSIISSQNEVGGWPLYNSGQAPLDSDHDGMPDSWEFARGLNPNASNDANQDRNGDGYTNIEEYINSLIPMPSDGTVPASPKNLRIS